MEDDQQLSLNEFSIELTSQVKYMKQVTTYLTSQKSLRHNNCRVPIEISDQFGSITSDLYCDPNNYTATKEQLLNLHYFLLRSDYFKLKPDMDIVSYIKKKIEKDIMNYKICCFRRSYKISEYLDLSKRKSEIYHKKKLLRKFYFPPADKMVYSTQFSQTFTAIISHNINMYIYEIQKGIKIGPFVLPHPHLESYQCQFKISNNGLFIYNDHYLMKNFEILKYIECIYVQFKDDSAQVLLCDSEFLVQLYDLLNQQTVFVIYIPISNFANFTHFDFQNNFLVQDSIQRSNRIQFQIKMNPDQILNM